MNYYDHLGSYMHKVNVILQTTDTMPTWLYEPDDECLLS